MKPIQTITRRLWMINLSYRHLCLTGADPLIYKRQRELVSECEKIRCKLVTTSRILTFRSYMVMMSDQIWEMPLSFINSCSWRTFVRTYVLQLAGALFKPKGITSHSYSPCFILNAVFHASCSATLILSADPIDHQCEEGGNDS